MVARLRPDLEEVTEELAGDGGGEAALAESSIVCRLILAVLSDGVAPLEETGLKMRAMSVA